MFTDSKNVKITEADDWYRREKLQYFQDFNSPWINSTAELNVEKLYKYAKENGHSFFLLTLYAVHNAINAVPQFKQRLLPDGRVAEFEKLGVVTTFMGKDHEFIDDLLEYNDNFAEYAAVAAKKMEKVKESVFQPYNLKGRKDIFFTSCVPWFSWKDLVIGKQSFKGGDLPHVAWDKMDARYNMRFSVQFSHCFADGYHLGELVNKLDEILQNPARL